MRFPVRLLVRPLMTFENRPEVIADAGTAMEEHCAEPNYMIATAAD